MDIIKDAIFANINIDNPAVADIIKSEEFQRLKKVSQFGVPDRFYHLKNFSRFEHSVGVFYILKSIGADEKEQIAGLLHDVSHAAFSHVIDWIYGSEDTEEYQDNFHTKFILESSIFKILKDYGYNPEEISDLHKFKLLDRDIPDLCVDRFEYAIREFGKNKATEYFEHISAHNNYVVFDDVDAARAFANDFIGRQINHWGGFEAVVRYRLFADAIKEAININILQHDDFWGKTEEEIVSIMINSKNDKILKILNLLETNKSLKFLSDENGVRLKKKFRYVDPLIKRKFNIVRLSDVDSEFIKRVNTEKEKNEEGVLARLS